MASARRATLLVLTPAMLQGRRQGWRRAGLGVSWEAKTVPTLSVCGQMGLEHGNAAVGRKAGSHS